MDSISVVFTIPNPCPKVNPSVSKISLPLHDGQIDFFEITVKEKKIYSKHSGYVEPLEGDEFEDYDEFIEEYPDLETPFTEEEYENIGDQVMYITGGGFGAVVSEENLPKYIDEMDL